MSKTGSDAIDWKEVQLAPPELRHPEQPVQLPMRTMVRAVANDFEALLMCNAMEAKGGLPFSVVAAPAYKTAHYPHYDMPAKWHVYGRVEVGKFDAVDDEFEVLMGKTPRP